MDDPNQPITSSDPNPDPADSSDQSAPDDVTFRFNHLQIDANNDSETDEEEEEEDDDDDDDDDGDFTFDCVADNDNDSSSADVTDDVQIRKVFPLFDQSLLLSGENDNDGDGKRRLPIDVPVDNVFIESPRRSPLSNGGTDGTVTALPKDSSEPDRSMKSNSTGFSKLWRFKNDEMNRSNSDGRDAFVFLESSGGATSSDAVGKGKGVKKGVKENKRKKLTASAHEVYLKQKGGRTEEERRRSYLPYRPGLMGFFTNVNGGLSKNVHPF